MTYVHGAHRQRQQVVPPKHDYEHEAKIAAAMWAHENAQTKRERLRAATYEASAWVDPKAQRRQR